MALKTITVEAVNHAKLKFDQHVLAHMLLDNLNGLELGPADHNDFGLPGSKSVAPVFDEVDFEFYKKGQVAQSGKYIDIDYSGEADAIPVDDNSQDYVLSSHVLEHIPDIFKAFGEWARVLRSGGYVFMIVPQRNALPSDAGRELTTYQELLTAFTEAYRPATMPQVRVDAANGHRGHYWVFTSQRLKEIISQYAEGNPNKWELIAEEDPDKKVGNGFCLVYRITKPEPEPVPEPEPEPELQAEVKLPVKPRAKKKV